jgi:hypothetical protein
MATFSGIANASVSAKDKRTPKTKGTVVAAAHCCRDLSYNRAPRGHWHPLHLKEHLIMCQTGLCASRLAPFSLSYNRVHGCSAMLSRV